MPWTIRTRDWPHPVPVPQVQGFKLLTGIHQIYDYLCAAYAHANMKIKDLEFTKFLSPEKIQGQVDALAEQINTDYKNKIPVFLPILNGSFIFAAELIKKINLKCRVSFVKISSYQGIQSTGQLKTLIGHDESLFNQDIIVVEDIVDSGLTLTKIMEELRSLGTKSVEAVSLIRKKPARTRGVDVKYVGFEIEEEFVLGYGLDYDGLGRNLNEIYKAKQQKIV